MKNNISDFVEEVCIVQSSLQLAEKVDHIWGDFRETISRNAHLSISGDIFADSLGSCVCCAGKW
jgi:hypothetical protein